MSCDCSVPASYHTAVICSFLAQSRARRRIFLVDINHVPASYGSVQPRILFHSTCVEAHKTHLQWLIIDALGTWVIFEYNFFQSRVFSGADWVSVSVPSSYLARMCPWSLNREYIWSPCPSALPREAQLKPQLRAQPGPVDSNPKSRQVCWKIVILNQFETFLWHISADSLRALQFGSLQTN